MASYGEAAPGAVVARTVTLTAGTYTLLCPIADHAARGMTAELTVTSYRGRSWRARTRSRRPRPGRGGVVTLVFAADVDTRRWGSSPSSWLTLAIIYWASKR